MPNHAQASLLSQTERYIKQALVHRNPLVASSALLCGLYLLRVSPEAIRRWSSEIAQSLLSADEMLQYHGFLLLFALRRNDRLALAKVALPPPLHRSSSPRASSACPPRRSRSAPCFVPRFFSSAKNPRSSFAPRFSTSASSASATAATSPRNSPSP